MAVSDVFYFHPYLGKSSNLTNIFSVGLKPPTSLPYDRNASPFKFKHACKIHSTSSTITLHRPKKHTPFLRTKNVWHATRSVAMSAGTSCGDRTGSVAMHGEDSMIRLKGMWIATWAKKRRRGYETPIPWRIITLSRCISLLKIGDIPASYVSFAREYKSWICFRRLFFLLSTIDYHHVLNTIWGICFFPSFLSKSKLFRGSSQLASAWSGSPIYKPIRSFGRGTTLLRGRTNHGY